MKIEKRKQLRQTISVSARCYGRWGGAGCRISQLSEAGLRFVSERPCEIGEELNVAWRPQHSSLSPIQFVCVVKRVNCRDVGAEISKISRADFLRLLELLFAAQRSASSACNPETNTAYAFPAGTVGPLASPAFA